MNKLGNIGMVLSLMCAIHCALMPVLVAAVSVAGLSFLLDPFWELLVLGCSSLLSVLAIFMGYRNHRNHLPFTIFFLSLALLIPGIIFHAHFFIASGSILTAVSLFINWRLNRHLHTATCRH